MKFFAIKRLFVKKQFCADSGTCKLRPDKDVSHCGQGGGVYGDEKLSTLHLGSGGGSGGNDNKLTDNPKGGK